MGMKSRLAYVLAGALGFSLLGGTGSSFADTITLNFNSLPSAQGWTYGDVNSVSEGSIFSIVNNALHQDTIGQGGGEGAGYSLSNVVANAPFTIAATMRATSQEYFYGDIWSNAAVSFGAEVSGLEYYVFIGPGAIIVSSPGGLNGTVVASSIIDPTQYHNYLLKADPTNGSFVLLVDGNQIFNGPADSVSPSSNYLFLGDGTSRANAIGDYSAFTYTTSATPLPSTWLMLLSGFVGLGFLAYRRTKKNAAALAAA
jgi:hypothetical protein